MGQKVRPTGFRCGITQPWRSRWFANNKDFGELVLEDFRIREFVAKNYEFAGIPHVEIERTRDTLIVQINTSRPGVVIGRKGQEVEKLKGALERLTGRRVDLQVREISNPNRSASLVAQDIAQQLVRRGAFRRAIKKALDTVVESGALGVRVQVSGRLGGAEMSRTEKASRGSVPLATLRRNVDYGFAIARTTMGVIGVKVWIDLGFYNSSEEPNGVDAKKGEAPKKPKRSVKR